MTLEEIQVLWEKDAPIDTTDLEAASAKIQKMHEFYYKIYLNEKKAYLIALKKYKILKHEKLEFLHNPNEQDKKEKGWKFPDRRLIKTQFSEYLEGDKELLDLELQIGLQLEKVEFVHSIIKGFQQRGFLIKNILEARKFQNGGY